MDVFYKLDVQTNQVEKVLDLEVQHEETPSSGFGVAMTFMVIGFFLGFIGMAGENTGLGTLGFIVGTLSLLIGVGIKGSKKE